jgi:hypothetical protein
MRLLATVAAFIGGAIVVVGGAGPLLHPTSSISSTASEVTNPASLPSAAAPVPRTSREAIPDEVLTEVVQRTCTACHNDAALLGGLSLQRFDVARAAASAPVAEKMIGKLRAAMMPPPGMPRPAGDTLLALVETLEARLDRAAARDPNPGDRSFQRLNRAEYEASIRDLLGLEIQGGAFLPLDTKSENFDNVADVQGLSPTLLDAYLNAAAEVTRLALGDRDATTTDVTYSVPGYASQLERVEGAPFGTRGGLSVTHNFPADGEYEFRVTFAHTTVGNAFAGKDARFEQVEISIDGVRVALLDIDQWLTIASPEAISMRTEPVFVRAGPKRLTAAFVRKTEGPVEDLLRPHDWSMSDRHTALGARGLTFLPHLEHLIVGGPYRVTGVSDTPIRQRIFSCRPISPDEERPCAESILTRLGSRAYRRPLEPRDLDGLMGFYDLGARDGGFEQGVRTGVQAILASPHFYFRFEEQPADVGAGEAYRISDFALASRLSFFLWGTPPDDELIDLAERGELSRERTLERQVARMLADPRAEALSTRFAAQWLRLQDLQKVVPHVYWYPDYDQQLADAMRRETEIFFQHLVREDRSFLELFTADYTFVNERLASHYGIPDVAGTAFQRVSYPDDTRRGILGHGSVLVQTSLASRTSPVLRGKWVMEVLLGTPPPPPPPGVPVLEETEGNLAGRAITTRERMEIHRKNEQCRSCHLYMDPMGLALDNFDLTGRWRMRENGMALDTRGEMYDGTAVASPADLRAALLRRPIPLVRTFTKNLMAYALGRGVDYYDMPTVRAIAAEAEQNGYRMSSFILGVVKSDAFLMRKAAAAEAGSGRN